MDNNNAADRPRLPNNLMEEVIRIALVVLLVALCVRVFAPFAHLILWSVILAVSLYPLYAAINRRLGNRPGRAATSVVLLGLLVLGTPTVILGSTFAKQVQVNYERFQRDELRLPKPSASVAEWPLVGDELYQAWDAAAADLPAYIAKNHTQFKDLSRRILSMAASTATGLLAFFGSLIIAGILMAYAQPGAGVVRRVLVRVIGEKKGPEVQKLATSTVRSVAMGVIGVAFIQALLLGLGFVFAGIPASGILAFLVLILGIAQLPAMIVSLPVVIWLWAAGDGGTTFNAAVTVYLLLAGSADNILKPLLLGRGVDAPMPVILIGALGGMVTAGIMGLFIGAVVLAVGYVLFMTWVEEGAEAAAADEAPPPAA